jgi:pectinesterase
MNKGILLAAPAALVWYASAAMAAGATITVINDLDVARPAATISVPFAELARLDPALRMFHVVVRDPKGRVLPSQITNYQHDHRGAAYDDLVFPYDFAAGEKRAVFTVESSAAATPPEPACAYARLVAERHDDMAWENDHIAHRMYGFALNTPAAGGERLRGSGIDIWGKRVRYLIVDRWYAKGHDQFHKDEEGEGLDLYSIGGSRGAGGTGVWDGAKLWTSDNFVKAEVWSNGPRRAAFKLTYAPWEAGAAGSVSETKQFTIDCGRNFDSVESVFDFHSNEAVVGIGITEHAQVEGFPKAVLTKDPDGRWMSFWEENKDGGLGIAVILAAGETPAGFAYEPPAKTPGSANNLLLVKARDGAPVRYFTGSAWSKGGFFADRASWEKFVKEHAVRALKPLTITVGARP